jgi:hypothetical protein
MVMYHAELCRVNCRVNPKDDCPLPSYSKTSKTTPRRVGKAYMVMYHAELCHMNCHVNPSYILQAHVNLPFLSIRNPNPSDILLAHANLPFLSNLSNLSLTLFFRNLSLLLCRKHTHLWG